jgi:hypothetical protein
MLGCRKGLLRNNAMTKYSETFTNSFIHGWTRQGYDLFRFAVINASQRPDECYFNDYSYDNCKQWKGLGMQVIELNRNSYHK